MDFVANFGPNVTEYKNFFALEDKIILCPFTNVSHFDSFVQICDL